jgi:anti-anti-sigma factor
VQFSSRRLADVIVAAPVGRVDHSSAGQFEESLTPLLKQCGNQKIALVLDFAGVEYISSVGLRVVMITAKQMREHEAKLALAALQPVVAEIFAISRFDRILNVHPSVRGALEHLSASALEAFDAT